MLYTMVDLGSVERFVAASNGFARVLRVVGSDQWAARTPCSEWDIRALANHVAAGNLNYVRLLDGATAADFLRMRDADALGSDPTASFDASVRECALAFARPGALDRVVDHPSGRLVGGQALAVRTTDTVIHTWDLARAAGADDSLDPQLLTWIDANIHDIYAGMAETPVSQESTHRFYAAPVRELGTDAPLQDRLLHLFGRDLAWTG
ncbi:MAG TPA: TIGR03086 family metal-binding protein [Micromonosporaceae bacterium]|jgi:uncharacterized protein (TIGR03086 family)